MPWLSDIYPIYLILAKDVNASGFSSTSIEGIITTDLEGVYAIKVSKDDNVLVFMSQGYESKEIEIKDLREISVELLQKE